MLFRSIPFTESELLEIEEPPRFPGAPRLANVKIRNTPVSPRENQRALFFEKKPFYIPMPGENRSVTSQIYNTKLGRGAQSDSIDHFGLKWEFEPTAGGSIVRPGNPILDDVNNWRDVIKLPNVNEWDWAAEAANTKVDLRFPTQVVLVNGFWFERLISFMDFMPAALALIDDEQTDALKDLFQAMTDLGCQVIDKFCEYWPGIDSFNVHDDWGAQKAPFFSNEVAYELFVPYMKQLTDHIHSKGRIATLHSCGHTEDRIQAYIDGGFDQWAPQTMNNIKELYDKYGDKIVLSVWHDKFDYANATEEEQRAEARKFVEYYTQPGKPVMIGINQVRESTVAFMDEVYIHSRKIYAERG